MKAEFLLKNRSILAVSFLNPNGKNFVVKYYLVILVITQVVLLSKNGVLSNKSKESSILTKIKKNFNSSNKISGAYQIFHALSVGTYLRVGAIQR